MAGCLQRTWRERPSSSAPAAVRRVKLTSTEARIVVASVLHELLSPCPASTGCQSMHLLLFRLLGLLSVGSGWHLALLRGHRVQWEQALADLEAAGASEPSLHSWRRGLAGPPRAVASAGVTASSTLESSNLTLSDSLSAAHHLLQLWLDCGPSDEGAGFAAAESPEIFARQATVTDSLAAVVYSCRGDPSNRAWLASRSPRARPAHPDFVHARICAHPWRGVAECAQGARAERAGCTPPRGSWRRERRSAQLHAAKPPSIPDHCLWGGLQALQCAIRQHVLPRFPAAAARGGVRMQAAALGLSLSVAALLLALLPGPELLHAAAAAAALQEEATAQTAPPGSSHSVSHPRAIPDSGRVACALRSSKAAPCCGAGPARG